METNYIEQIAKDVRTKIERRTPSFFYTYDGEKFKKDKLVDVALSDLSYLKDIGQSELAFQYAENPSKKSKDNREIVNYIEKEINKEVVAGSNIVGSTFDIDDYIPCIDLKSNKRFLIDKEKKIISQVSYEAWSAITPKEHPRVPAPARLVFNPMQSEPFSMQEFDGKQVAFINQYKHPDWMKIDGKVVLLPEEEQNSIQCPRLIMEFMEHLLPDYKSRNFVFNWMYYALVSRCQTYLVLNGKKGVGKGILCEYLLQNLVGESNYRIAPESMLESNFNAALENIRILVLDEINADNTAKVNKLKKYANDNQNLEKKGIDATNMTKVYYSSVISNNDLFDMKLTWDERRFSVVDLANESLLDSWGKEKIDELIEYLKEPEVIRQFGFYILYRGRDYNLNELSVFKGKRFYDIVYHSLSEWQKVVVDLILSKDTDDVFNLSECRTEYKRRIPNGKFPSSRNLKIEKFLEDFRYYDDKLGELEYDEDEKEFYIVKDNKFASRKSTNKQEQNVESESEYGLL